MEPSERKVQRIAFDRFEVDLRSGELLKNDRRLRLQAQPFQLLALLLERPGEVVTREEICRALWQADTFVDFDHSLGTAINKIREALGDSADHPRFVETLPRRGYRFIGKIEASSEPPPSQPGPASSDAIVSLGVESVADRIEAGSRPAAQKSRRSPRQKFLLVLTASLAVLLSALVFFRRSEDSRATIPPCKHHVHRGFTLGKPLRR